MSVATRPTFALANVSVVTPQLLIGGDLSPHPPTALRQLVELVRAGVTHIVDCREEWEDAELVATLDPSIHYRRHGMDDTGQRVPSEWFEAGVTFALRAMQGAHAVVLTHCHMGINRGPSLGYAVLLGLGWDPIAALDAIRSARPIAAVAYAEDALRWHHERSGAGAAVRRTDNERIRHWRERDTLDVEHVIREIRTAEGR